jgi:hypothetical protein
MIHYTLAVGRIVMRGGSGGMNGIMRILVTIAAVDMNVHGSSTEHWTELGGWLQTQKGESVNVLNRSESIYFSQALAASSSKSRWV